MTDLASLVQVGYIFSHSSNCVKPLQHSSNKLFYDWQVSE